MTSGSRHRRRRVPAPARLGVAQAVALGLLQGPTELLPVSSSGHATLLPWLVGSRYPSLDPPLRKTLEVALHVGTAAALLVALRQEVVAAARDLDGRRVLLTGASLAPPAVAGLLVGDVIEERLGTPGTISAALLAGSAAMVWADRAPATRSREEAGALDGLALGVAQAAALVPGVSRNGATLVAARLRRFRRPDAQVLSRHVALPVIAAAGAVRAARLTGAVRRGDPLLRESLPALAAGTAAALVSTLASARLISAVERSGSLAPYAAYRAALALLAIRRLRHNPRR